VIFKCPFQPKLFYDSMTSTLQAREDTTMEQVDISLGKLHPMGRIYAIVGGKCEEEGMTKKYYYDLTITPLFPCTTQEKEVEELGMRDCS